MRKLFRRLHKRTKAIRGRGSLTQQQLARLKYLRGLEREYDFLEACLVKLLRIRSDLNSAWRAIDDQRVVVMADQAQQRLHQLGKEIARRIPRSIA